MVDFMWKCIVMEKKHHFRCGPLIFNLQRNFKVKMKYTAFRPPLHKRQAVSIDANNSTSYWRYLVITVAMAMLLIYTCMLGFLPAYSWLFFITSWLVLVTNQIVLTYSMKYIFGCSSYC